MGSIGILKGSMLVLSKMIDGVSGEASLHVVAAARDRQKCSARARQACVVACPFLVFLSCE
jgi:hypothetical protein